MVQLLLQRAGHFCFQHLQTQESSPLHHAIIGGNVLCLKILIKFLQKFSSFIIGPDTKTVKILQSAFLLKNKSENSIFYQSGITENVAQAEWNVNINILLQWIDIYGKTALAMACSLQTESIRTYLIRKNSTPSPPSSPSFPLSSSSFPSSSSILPSDLYDIYPQAPHSNVQPALPSSDFEIPLPSTSLTTGVRTPRSNSVRDSSEPPGCSVNMISSLEGQDFNNNDINNNNDNVIDHDNINDNYTNNSNSNHNNDNDNNNNNNNNNNDNNNNSNNNHNNDNNNIIDNDNDESNNKRNNKSRSKNKNKNKIKEQYSPHITIPNKSPPVEIVKILLSLGGDIACANIHTKYTPLMEACAAGTYVQFLTEEKMIFMLLFLFFFYDLN